MGNSGAWEGRIPVTVFLQFSHFLSPRVMRHKCPTSHSPSSLLSTFSLTYIYANSIKCSRVFYLINSKHVEASQLTCDYKSVRVIIKRKRNQHMASEPEYENSFLQEWNPDRDVFRSLLSLCHVCFITFASLPVPFTCLVFLTLMSSHLGNLQ